MVSPIPQSSSLVSSTTSACLSELSTIVREDIGPQRTPSVLPFPQKQFPRSQKTQMTKLEKPIRAFPNIFLQHLQ